MNSTQAIWYDGAHGRARSVEIVADANGLLLLHPDGRQSLYTAASLRSEEPFDGLLRVIELPDGGIVHTRGAADLFSVRRVSAMRAASRWWSASLCALLLVLVVIGLDQFALARAARLMVGWVPESVDRKLGQAILDAADRSWLKTSKLPKATQSEIRERFEAATPGMEVLVTFRRNGIHGGFNAFALPGGTIVVLDGMAEDLTSDELMWVLGHEVGHTVHRDGMQGLARAFGLGAVASAFLGDFSGWAAGVVASVPIHGHERDAEREADAYMRAFARRNHLPAGAQVTLWEKVKEIQDETGSGDIPDWLSTHPSTQERLEEATKAANP